MDNLKDLQKAILKISIRLFKLSNLLSIANKLSPEEKESIEKEYKELSQTLEKLKAEYMRNAKTEDSQKISNTYKRKEKVLEKNEFEEIRDELIKARLRLITLDHILSKDNLSGEEREKKERVLSKGLHKVYFINPKYAGQEILGIKVLSSLEEVPEPVDIVNVFRNPAHIEPIFEEALKIGAKCALQSHGLFGREGKEQFLL